MILKKNISLKNFNTFNIDVLSKLFVEIENNNDLDEIIENDYLNKNNYLILGSGSNILFTKNFDGIILKNNTKGLTIEDFDNNYSLVKVSSGEIWHDFVLKTIENNLYGLENLSYIPGTVGASVVQNIGAYGVEVKDFIYSVITIDINNNLEREYYKEECNFAYRESIFKRDLKNKVFIKEIIFKLNKKEIINASYKDIQNRLEKYNIKNPNSKDISNLVIEIRKEKLPNPSIVGNAGSFFKNPTVDLNMINNLKDNYPEIPFYKLDNSNFKIPAAWLIDKLGWKGKSFGEYGVHKNHALVLINYGNAKGIDIKLLSDEIKNSVFDKFEINLEVEVNII